MMGERQVAQEALFYAFSLERHVPADHWVRAIDRFVDLSDIRAHLRPFYSEMGRPSIDPELMIRLRTSIIQQQTGRPVPFELTDTTREALTEWLRRRPSAEADWLFPSRSRKGDHVTTRQYGRQLDDWVALIGLDPALYGTHSLRRTKVALIYKRTGNLRACQLLLGHSKLESTSGYFTVNRAPSALSIAAGSSAFSARRASSVLEIASRLQADVSASD